MEIVSEQLFVSKLSDMPNLQNANVSQKKEMLKSKFLEFTGFIPVTPLIFHLLIVVHIPSDCTDRNARLSSMYLIILHLFTFIGELFYYTPFNTNWRQQKTWIIIKSSLLTLNLFAFTLIRAKPYKCLVDFSSFQAAFIFCLCMLYSIFFAYHIDKHANSDNGQLVY